MKLTKSHTWKYVHKFLGFKIKIALDATHESKLKQQQHENINLTSIAPHTHTHVMLVKDETPKTIPWELPP